VQYSAVGWMKNKDEVDAEHKIDKETLACLLCFAFGYCRRMIVTITMTNDRTHAKGAQTNNE
jgi:hypothetical protein